MQRKESPGVAMMRMGEEIASSLQEGIATAPELSPEEVDRAVRAAQKLLAERMEHEGDMRIYDFRDWSLEVDLQKKEILEIEVLVITGDEIVRVVYEDHTEDNFDAGRLLFNGRMIDDEDYAYILDGDEIQEWLKFEPKEDAGVAASYQRARAFKAVPGPGMLLWEE